MAYALKNPLVFQLDSVMGKCYRLDRNKVKLQVSAHSVNNNSSVTCSVEITFDI